MTQERTKDEIYRGAVDEILHYMWDPIGVAGIPAARDEYTNYVGEVVEMVSKGSNLESIAQLLNNIAVQRMGLSPNIANCIDVAKSLIDWYEAVNEMT